MESCVAKDLECELEQLSARNVYDYADKLLERLSEEGVITLDELAINDKTFDYVTKKLNQYEIFPKYEIINLFPSPKSDELAVNRRIKGNELFKDEKYFSALCCYNESLCLASPDSETLGLAYANRSAVYFEIGEYTLCLENIQRAKDSKYPSVLISKLDKRERLCRQQIKEKPKSPIALQLMHKANPNYPYIADCLKLKQNSEFGRHIITEKSLKAGEVIAIEEPFIALLNTKSVYKRCTNCLGQFNLNLQPCANCTSAMFCSQKCLQVANKNFHQFECNLSNILTGLFFTNAARTAVRMFLEALVMFKGSFVKLEAFIKKNRSPDFTTFDLDTTQGPAEFKKRLFIAIDSLCTNEEKRSSIEKFRRVTVSIVITDFLEKHSKLSMQLKDDTTRKFLIGFLYKHIQIAESNYHELYALSPELQLQNNEEYGVGCFPFSSLLNHSCAPNVLRLTFDARNYVIISRNIAPGEQIFDNYGYHHTLHARNYRQQSLLDRYQFKCECVGCRNNLPLFENLLEVDENFDAFIQNDIERLEMLTVNEATAAIKKYSRYINQHVKNFPCYEISISQECMLRSFRAFEKTKLSLKLIDK